MWKKAANGNTWSPQGATSGTGEEDYTSILVYDGPTELDTLKDFLRQNDEIDERNDNNVTNPWYRHVNIGSGKLWDWAPQHATGEYTTSTSGDVSANNRWKESALAAHLAGKSSNLRIKITWYPAGGFVDVPNYGADRRTDKYIKLKMQMYLPD